jgi:hypothetical protein
MSTDASFERFEELITSLCVVIDLPDAQSVLKSRRIEVDGFSVTLENFDTDPDSLYILFDYGIPTAGRTLCVFRLMLESNLLVYAQDEAQMGVDPETGAALLVVRVPMTEGVDGTWLAQTLAHYSDHGRYWRDNMMQSTDDLFEGIASGQYHWLRA